MILFWHCSRLIAEALDVPPEKIWPSRYTN
ncbi:helix-turn-helix domain-containing protein [Erwinia sp. OPT-41]|uniref:Helix-turn-helix domain-containing protein n=1 Tax=Erwinia plantamica TaxID=3237104 RepID=A0ABW7CLA7_9GAMM